ncbi:MAG: hypothetical protein K0R98_1283 [Rickettsiaceae bacterium]|jgi:uncharacterized Zn-finger protein|nr:hypothetical protein [Rickettsiaceae bacterium]
MKDEDTKVSCDGGNTSLGHPKVYLEFGKKTVVECPYCGKKFTADKKA